jgi:hypothetical protein
MDLVAISDWRHCGTFPRGLGSRLPVRMRGDHGWLAFPHEGKCPRRESHAGVRKAEPDHTPAALNRNTPTEQSVSSAQIGQ